MQTSSLVAVAVRPTAALSSAASWATPRGAAATAPGPYAKRLSTHIGKQSFVSENLTVANDRTQSTAEPSGAVAFPLAGVATGFVWFENKTDRVGVPLASLRVALRKQIAVAQGENIACATRSSTSPSERA
jgi:hypothetical protein